LLRCHEESNFGAEVDTFIIITRVGHLVIHGFASIKVEITEVLDDPQRSYNSNEVTADPVMIFVIV
jgi:hypothetical protein